mmetsp:Transcript_3642/g.12946  ORF Transcript_3642/g.12946 Transcript_3642/m.12946 type:complete len:223 (+) Transcript_3642:933-1601(+)
MAVAGEAGAPNAREASSVHTNTEAAILEETVVYRCGRHVRYRYSASQAAERSFAMSLVLKDDTERRLKIKISHLLAVLVLPSMNNLSTCMQQTGRSEAQLDAFKHLAHLQRGDFLAAVVDRRRVPRNHLGKMLNLSWSEELCCVPLARPDTPEGAVPNNQRRAVHRSDAVLRRLLWRQPPDMGGYQGAIRLQRETATHSLPAEDRAGKHRPGSSLHVQEDVS